MENIEQNFKTAMNELIDALRVQEAECTYPDCDCFEGDSPAETTETAESAPRTPVDRPEVKHVYNGRNRSSAICWDDEIGTWSFGASWTHGKGETFTLHVNGITLEIPKSLKSQMLRTLEGVG